VVLQLQVRLNATTMHTGGAISAAITIFNPLDESVSIDPESQPNPSILDWNSRDFSCGGLAASNPTWSLAGYALFEGHYTSANVSFAADPLTLTPPLTFSCPAMSDPSTVVFLPNSSSTVAYIPPSPFQPPIVMGQAAMNATTQACVFLGYYNCSGSSSLFGYWTSPPGGVRNAENATISSPYFHYFPPGEYTLVVEDEWGPAVFSYFLVSGTTPPAYTVTVQTNQAVYSGTSPIVVTGIVSPPPGPNTGVVVTVTSPTGAAVDISDDSVNGTTGAFSHITVAGGSANWVTGTYTVNAVWGGDGATASGVATFTYATPA